MTRPAGEPVRTGVGVLDRCVAVLDAVAQGPAPLAELTARTGLPRATAHRLAVALEAHGLLARDPSGAFVVGARAAALAASPGLDPLLGTASPVLARLRDATGESAQLYVRRGAQRQCVAAADRDSGLRDTVPVGALLPLSAGSAAQVLLAWLPPQEAAEHLDGAVFDAAGLAAVRGRGWASSAAQREAGLASVSAPVRGDGRVVAALGVSGPLDRVGGTPSDALVQAVVDAAGQVTTTLAAASRG